MKRIFTIGMLAVLSTAVFSQISISGTVTDKATDSPLVAANVFIAGTQAGVTTADDGTYVLENLPEGTAQLVVSYVGYKPWSREVPVREGMPMQMDAKLAASGINLGTVEVTARATNKRKRYLKRFERAFFGNTPSTAKCTLLNPEVLLFEEKGHALTARATDLLRIKNEATGYLVLFLLENFEQKGDEISYAGKPFFKPLPPAGEKQAARWAAERERAYRGSLAHFIKALTTGRLAAEGWEVHLGQMQNNAQFVSNGRVKAPDILEDGATPFDKTLRLNGFLKVVYLREKGAIKRPEAGNISLGRDHETGLMDRGTTRELSNQVSYLFARKSRVKLYTGGRVAEPQLLVEYGHFATEGIAELVPLDFEAPPQQSVPKLNGFELTNLKIPAEEIKRGGPPRDGIPSIDTPRFLAAANADFLKKDDLVLGVQFNGVAKAYPIRILNWHEIVNDVFDDEGVVVSYCPLCGSGMAFRAETPDGSRRQFGVSGLLYNSDVLLYDRQTQSLWSQILSEAVAGKAAGQRLEYIPTQFTTWESWKAAHPGTRVLSTATGYRRDYSASPYGDYERTGKLMFPVKERSDALPAKARIIGVEVNGVFRAYPVSVLAKHKTPFSDEVNGRVLTLSFDKIAQSASVTLDGKLYPSVSMFWFAWYAFHPATTVYRK